MAITFPAPRTDYDWHCVDNADWVGADRTALDGWTISPCPRIDGTGDPPPPPGAGPFKTWAVTATLQTPPDSAWVYARALEKRGFDVPEWGALQPDVRRPSTARLWWWWWRSTGRRDHREYLTRRAWKRPVLLTEVFRYYRQTLFQRHGIPLPNGAPDDLAFSASVDIAMDSDRKVLYIQEKARPLPTGVVTALAAKAVASLEEARGDVP